LLQLASQAMVEEQHVAARGVAAGSELSPSRPLSEDRLAMERRKAEAVTTDAPMLVHS
jgi:hypothetical protein